MMKSGVAIVGMACRYPDASSPGELWTNVLAGRRAFRRIPPERLRVEDYFAADAQAVRAGLKCGNFFELRRLCFQFFVERKRVHSPAILRTALDTAILAVADTLVARMPAAAFLCAVHEHPDLCDQVLRTLELSERT